MEGDRLNRGYMWTSPGEDGIAGLDGGSVDAASVASELGKIGEGEEEKDQ